MNVLTLLILDLLRFAEMILFLGDGTTPTAPIAAGFGLELWFLLFILLTFHAVILIPSYTRIVKFTELSKPVGRRTAGYLSYYVRPRCIIAVRRGGRHPKSSTFRHLQGGWSIRHVEGPPDNKREAQARVERLYSPLHRLHAIFPRLRFWLVSAICTPRGIAG